MKTLITTILASAMIIAISSCGQEAEVTGKPQWDDTVAYRYKRTEKITGDCKHACLTIKIKSLHLDDLALAQQTIDSLMLNIGANTYTSMDMLVDESVEEFSRLLEEIPSYDMPWEIERMAVVNFNEYGLLGVSISDYSFTGGAHPNSHHIHCVFRTSDGAMLFWEDFITAEQKNDFTAFAERKFRNNKNLKENESLEKAGFWFEGNLFYLPQNFFVDDSGFHFFYNTYEIAPHSAGAIILDFSWEDIRPFLAKPYVDIFSSTT
jgi:uncharacterized lipoprotein YehR (DUF1307 family)